MGEEKMSINVEANEIIAENSALVYCKQRNKTVKMGGSRKGCFSNSNVLPLFLRRTELQNL